MQHDKWLTVKQMHEYYHISKGSIYTLRYEHKGKHFFQDQLINVGYLTRVVAFKQRIHNKTIELYNDLLDYYGNDHQIAKAVEPLTTLGFDLTREFIYVTMWRTPNPSITAVYISKNTVMVYRAMIYLKQKIKKTK